jgi:transketolase
LVTIAHGRAGLALAAKVRGQHHRTFIILSDGECYEGTVWEGALRPRRA